MLHDQTEKAKALIGHGFRVFPCKPGEKVPETAHGCKDAIADASKINGQFLRGENVAIATGEGIFVIDFDETGGVEKFEDQYGPLPATVAAATPRGGWHYYFQSDKPVKNSQSKLADQVDVRGEGGYVLCSPSMVNGKAYQWLPGCAPGEVGIAVAPEWLMRLVSPPAPRAEPSPSLPRPSPVGSSVVERCRKYLSKLPPAISGQGGHNATLEAAATCFRFGLDAADALILLAEYNSNCQPQWSERELRHKLEDAHKLVSATGEFGCMLKDNPATSRPASTVPTRKPATASDIFGIELGEREPATDKIILSPKRTLPTAKAFVKEHYQHADGRTLHTQAGEMLMWKHGQYFPIEEAGIAAQLSPWLHKALRWTAGPKGPILVPFESNPMSVKAALETVKSHTYIPMDREQPTWLGNMPNIPPAGETLACQTKLLHLPTLKEYAATPLFFTRVAVSFDYEAEAPEPTRWLNFLEELWPNDLESPTLLQDWFGYSLTPDTSQQKILLVVGPKRSGKGTVARVLSELLGRGNTASPTLCGLAGNFGLQPLLGRTLAIISDARLSGQTDQAIIVERLLSISGEDSIDVARKFKDAVRVKLPTRFVILTNELPRLADSSGALSSRFLTLVMTRSFYGHENTRLTSQLLEELPGILNWATVGWKRLHQRGHFVEPGSSAEARQMLEDLGSPIGAFLRDVCIVETGREIETIELFKRWQSWCEGQGREHPGSIQTFGRDLRAALPSLKVIQHRDGDRVPRHYTGLGVRHDM